MKRKLIQMAGKTMVVSLPSPWIKKYGLKKGEEIDLEEKGKNILIKIDSKKENMGKEILIDIPTEDLFFERSLHVWYRRGYNQITVIFEDKDVLRKIRKSVKKLLGFEIIKESKNSCVIKSVATGMENQLDNIIRRIFLSLITMAKESQENIKSKTYKNLNDTLLAEEDNNLKCFFCERLLNKEGYKTPEKTSSIYSIVWTLEQIADEYKKIAKFFLDKDNKAKISNDIIKVYFETTSDLEMVYHLFYKRNLNELKKQKMHLKKLKKDSLNLFLKKDPNMIILHHLMIIHDKLGQITLMFA